MTEVTTIYNRILRRLVVAAVWSDESERAAILDELDADAAGYDDVDAYRADREAEADEATRAAKAEAEAAEQAKADELAELRAENERLRASQAEAPPVTPSPFTQ